MLSRRPDEPHEVFVLGDSDVVGGAGLAEAGADPIEFGADGDSFGGIGSGSQTRGPAGQGRKSK